MELFENLFVKAIVVPLVITLTSAILEIAPLMIHGTTSRGESKYVVWLAKGRSRKTDQTIADIRATKEVIDIDKMTGFHVTNFRSLPINLVMAAFTVDISALVNNQNNGAVSGYIFMGHLFLLVTIIILCLYRESISPQEAKKRAFHSLLPIIVGFLAMITAFFSI